MTLAYHGVNETSPGEDPMALVMPPALLESQVRLLLALGYRVVTAEQLLAEHGPGRPGNGTAVLTFDDGWLDAVTMVAPLLRRLGVRATFYLNPSLWGTAHPQVSGPAGRLMTADQARELVDAGMELGAHSMRHDDLRTLDDATLAADLRDCKESVESVTGRPCRTLAYPFGAHDARVRAAACTARYELAWAWLPGRWDPFAAPRIPGPTRRGGAHLALKLAGVGRRRRIGPPPVPVASVSR